MLESLLSYVELLKLVGLIVVGHRLLVINFQCLFVASPVELGLNLHSLELLAILFEFLIVVVVDKLLKLVKNHPLEKVQLGSILLVLIQLPPHLVEHHQRHLTVQLELLVDFLLIELVD